jgi:deoxyribodipyrimidine photo-lyase
MTQQQSPVTIVWMRRDLRIEDNAALYHALKHSDNVIPLFIFDKNILEKLRDKTDKRVLFIHQQLAELKSKLIEIGSDLLVEYGRPLEVWQEVINRFSVKDVYTNHDYETYALERDSVVKELFAEKNISFHTYKDHVIFEKGEVLKDDGLPYTVFTPYSKKWRASLTPFHYKSYPVMKYASSFAHDIKFPLPSLSEIGFQESNFQFPEKVVSHQVVSQYHQQRDFPAVNGTSRLGIHLRFGTLSVRKLLAYALERNQTFVNELIWRDFYQMILAHFPHVEHQPFRKDYSRIEWLNNEVHFKSWCEGKTGYPIVDAGMRELNLTGYMHNRVRMIVASFLTKHLLIDWRWGEAYFAEKLLDFDLASNNGGWQWAAGCGTDAAPYFRVFNPTLQAQKFDPQFTYVKKWVPEWGTIEYPLPIVEHDMARKRAIACYKEGLSQPL